MDESDRVEVSGMEEPGRTHENGEPVARESPTEPEECHSSRAASPAVSEGTAKTWSASRFAHPPDPLIGVVLDGRYRIEARIGAGAMGTVYRALQTKVGRAVAVKMLSSEASQDEALVERFETEARIISELRHPYTLKLIDFGRAEEGRLFIVTELLLGETLDKILRKGPLDPLIAVRTLRQISESLEEAHAKGIIHRDLKPGNVFVERVEGQEVIKVLDFGIAKLTQGTTRTATGTVFGTPAYMSPEQATGATVDARTDLYSLGVIAYECVTGVRPFQGENAMELLFKHVNDTPPPLREVAPGLACPPELDALIHSLLDKRPDARPENVSQVKEILARLERHLLTGDLGAAMEGAGSPPRPPEPSLLITERTAGVAPPSDASPASKRLRVGIVLCMIAVVLVILVRAVLLPSPPSVVESSIPIVDTSAPRRAGSAVETKNESRASPSSASPEAAREIGAARETARDMGTAEAPDSGAAREGARNVGAARRAIERDAQESASPPKAKEPPATRPNEERPLRSHRRPKATSSRPPDAPPPGYLDLELGNDP